MRVAVLLTIVSATLIASAISGCGETATGTSSPAALRLQREDLVAVTRALRRAEGSIGQEVTAARTGWAVVADGLAASIPASTLPAVRTAAQKARQVVVPTLLTEERARELTGPGAGIVGRFRTFAGLATRGWAMIAAAIEGIEQGTPTVAGFHRANVALYIDSVYDGHFELSEIGKSLLAAYSSLGGAPAFDGTLTGQEVDALADAYSPGAARLEPHPGVVLGS
ncbi:MAG TPA: hypothetical protein VGG98_04800 [Solirubrobacteraceae bacterium]|jgi:hypothetical protein